MRTVLLALFLISIQFAIAQDYNQIDSIVNTYPKKFKSIEDFADRIKQDFKTDINRTRATYFWISNAIFYDFKTANSNRIKDIIYTGKEDLEKLQFAYAEKVLKENKGICEGYSQLLKYTLAQLDIECKVIEGYAKNDISEITKVKNESNHAWNAVFIDNKWQLIDTTWSTGNEPNKPNHFDFRDAFFLIKPELLIWSHFPDDKQWQLLDKPISRLTFFYAPIIHVGYYTSDLKLKQMKGIVKSKKTIHIVFEAINEDNQYYYQYSQYSSNLEPVEFIKKGNYYIAEIPFDYKKGKELLIFNGFKPCLSFKII